MRNVGERHVPDTPTNRQLFALDKCLDMVTHTIKICSNENVFDAKFKTTTEKIVSIANSIYIKAFEANGIRVTNNYTKVKRLRLQKEAIRLCNVMLAEINIAQRLFHIKKGKKLYWVKMVIEARTLLSKWHESDKKRYSNVIAKDIIKIKYGV